MTTGFGWSSLPDGWWADLLCTIYGSCCIAFLLAHAFEPYRRWLKARMPQRWIRLSRNYCLTKVWSDLVLSAGGLAFLAWIEDSLVAALGLLAVALFGSHLWRFSAAAADGR